MPRTSHPASHQACSTTADVRAQRRRARVIDDGCRIILSQPSTPSEVISSLYTPTNSDFDHVEYLGFSRERWDGIVAPGRARSSSVGALPPSIFSVGPLAENDGRHTGSLHQGPTRLEPLMEDSTSLSAPRSSGPERSHYQRIQDQTKPSLDHMRGGRWVLDPKSGFEMYVPPSSPRRALRPRMGSTPAPPKRLSKIRPPQPLPKQNTIFASDHSEHEVLLGKLEPSPVAPVPMPPSLAKFWGSDPRPTVAHEPAPASPVNMRDTPFLDHAAECERRFLNLLARDCGSGILLQEIAATPTTATHRSSASKTSSRKSAGIAGKLSSGISMGIPSFFRARRNTTASQSDKQCGTTVLSH